LFAADIILLIFSFGHLFFRYLLAAILAAILEVCIAGFKEENSAQGPPYTSLQTTKNYSLKKEENSSRTLESLVLT